MKNKVLLTEINREFEITIENCVRRVLNENTNPQSQPPDPSLNKISDVININTARKLLNYSKSTLYSKISKDQIPVYSRGRPLIFSRKELLTWLKDGRPKMTDEYLQKLRKLGENEI